MENENPTPPIAAGVTLEHASRRTSLITLPTRRTQGRLAEIETGIVMVWVAGELHIRCAAWEGAK